MSQIKDELNKLRRRLLFASVLAVVALAAGVGFMFLAVSPTFQSQAGYGTLVPSGANATYTATQTLSSTTTESRQPVAPLSSNYAMRPSFIYAALISWSMFAGALIWRGHVRTVWAQSRFSYDTFRLLVRMRGAETRLKLMRSLSQPRNKLQLASTLDIDWKAVDKHVQALEGRGLIRAAMTSGTATFYEVTDKGKKALEVLEELNTPAG